MTSDTPEIRPALSEEEWEALLRPLADWDDTMLFVNGDVARGVLLDTGEVAIIVLTDWDVPENPAGLAAALLHRHPAGVTWEELAALRDALACSGTVSSPDNLPLAQRAVAKLAALLPPREQT